MSHATTDLQTTTDQQAATSDQQAATADLAVDEDLLSLIHI